MGDQSNVAHSRNARIIPDRLPAISDRWAVVVRPLWFVAFACAVLIVIAGTAYVLHDTYENNPVFAEIGLTTAIENDGSVTLGQPIGAESRGQGIAEGSRIAAIDGRPVARETRVDALAERVRAAAGPVIMLRIADPHGVARDHRLTRSPLHARQARAGEPISRNARMLIRLTCSGLGCVSLLVCAVMLFMRRSRDPVAMMMSAAFLTLAATIDPPLLMWLSLGLGDAYDVVSSAAWALLIVALAAFPNGRFEPPWLRWMLPLALPLAAFLSLDSVNSAAQLAVAIGLPLALLGGQAARYRRLEPGIERQQIKWAAFGFVAGFTLIGVALAGVVVFPPEPLAAHPVATLVYTSLFSLGFAILPLGLMVSLIRFRLWEADTIISQSAAYTLIVVVIGIAWAASSDLVKQMVAALLGEHNGTVATTLSAIVAAGVFAPTQSFVLGWTKRHFKSNADRLRDVAAQLANWRNSESPAEIGARSLEMIAGTVHASSVALVGPDPLAGEVIAARNVDPDDLRQIAPDEDTRFPIRLPLEVSDEPVGMLLVGPRSDGNRYNRHERDALSALARPLAEAIRFARSQTLREDSLRRMIHAVEMRLAQIEGGPGKAAPA
ncbi:MAG TPA: hypothetical protein VFT56_13945 [Sphingomonas sp.]|nr:hypothetical protein [Sphingomonas sp.]